MLQWLRAIRKEKGLSQSRVADAAQIPSNTNMN